MNSASKFFWGFLFGGVLGAGVAILAAPQSGEDLRTQIREGYQKLVDEMNNASQQKRAEMEAQLSALKKPRRSDV